MDILRAASLLVVTTLALAGCVREEEALTDNQSPPIGEGSPPAPPAPPVPPAPVGLSLTAPADQQTEATAPLTMVVLGQPAASGGDGSYTYGNDAPAGGFPLGSATVMWTVTDGTGAEASATQSVAVADTTAPALMTPPDLLVEATGPMTTVSIGNATATDLVDMNPAVSNDMAAGGFPIGTHMVTWTASDASGNVTTAPQMVTVSAPSSGPLMITPPGNITMEATGPSTTVMLGAANVMGGELPIVIMDDAPAGGFPVGATTVTWTATDAAMMSVTGSQTITITDTTAPTITAPADVMADQAPTLGNTSVILGTPVFADIADPNPAVTNNAPANGFPSGTTTVVWTARDASGNSTSDSQIVTINPFIAELCSSMVTEFTNVIYPIMDSAMPPRCEGCHTGPAPLNTPNGFAFPNDPPGLADFELFRTIAAIDSGGQSLILVKATGGASHVGGDRFEDRELDPDYVAFADFVNRAAVCQADPPVNQVTIDMGTGYEQLHKVVGSLASRIPSSDEVNAVDAAPDQNGIDIALDPILDGLMSEDAFYTRIQEMYNDLFLTNKEQFDRGNVENNFDLDALANRSFYEDNYDGGERDDLREATNYGIARAPVELVKYIVANDRPFTEIVTADYTMVNPYSAVIYDVNAGDSSFRFDSDRNQANHDRDDFRPVTVIRQEDGTLVPAAGVFGTHAFLSRYPSTNTNVNRKRGRYVFDYFLGIDIESLAARDGLDLDNVIGDVPTYEDPQCTVCHETLDPIAGLFTNRDNFGEYDRGNRFVHTRTTNGVPRMVPAGYSIDPADVLPDSEEDTALQWLGMRVAQDDRFADKTVRTVFRGLTGIDVTTPATTAFINATKSRFVGSGFNFKLLVKDIVTSDYFMARNLSQGEDPNAYADVGAARLITAEELDRKLTAIAGGNYDWRGPNSRSGLRGRHYLLYGGIDSDEVTTRTTSPTALIDGIQERIANQFACERVAADLYGNGTLFPFAGETDVPDGGAGDTAIRENIRFLHRHILGEDLPLNDPEIGNTYQLFVDVRAEGETSIPNECRGGGGSTDSNGTVLPWMAVVTYLLADYQFLYE
jgi:hypothetical protein